MSKLTVTDIQMRLRQLHTDLNQGNVFTEILPAIDELILSRPHRTRTAVDLVSVSPHFQHQLDHYLKLAQEKKVNQLDQQFVTDLLSVLGTDRGDLREEIMMLLSSLLEDNQIEKDDLKRLFRYLIRPEIMYNHILEPRNKAVFGRTLALGMLRLILYGDRAGYFFLTSEDVQSLVDALGLYAVLERDPRGFVNGSGWAHAFSVLPSLGDELCHHNELVRGDKIFLQAVIVESYRLLPNVLSMGENEEMGGFLLSLMGQHELYQRFFKAQLSRWKTDLDHDDPASNEAWSRIFNYRHLMQSMLLDGRLPHDIVKQIVDSDQQN